MIFGYKYNAYNNKKYSIELQTQTQTNVSAVPKEKDKVTNWY